jgi:hypothetical protein
VVVTPQRLTEQPGACTGHRRPLERIPPPPQVLVREPGKGSVHKHSQREGAVGSELNGLLPFEKGVPAHDGRPEPTTPSMTPIPAFRRRPST